MEMGHLSRSICGKSNPCSPVVTSQESTIEIVRQRLLRASAVLEEAGVPYAVAGGNAVAAWVSRIDEAAVRNTQDVDLLLRREDLERAKAAMANAGFVFR